MIRDKLDADTKDLKIISMFMKNPFSSQSIIAKELKLTQPSINLRIQKLKKNGLLNFHAGLDYSKLKLFLSRVDFTAKDPNKVLNRLRNCSFFVNGFIMSGKNNVSIFVVTDELRKSDDIVNENLRNDSEISDINVNLVVSTANEFLFKINLLNEIHPEICYEKDSCEKCKLTKEAKPSLKVLSD
ncbi:MAG TPA: Lrp/AsnC family transcriptional regulator [archaeon]|nr:Lrp/AsnC family transcriptional regulator [archaeon]